MKIGIDLDGVLYDTEKMYRVYSELYDILQLNQNSKVDNKELLLQNRFKWTKEQVDDFFKKYDEEIMCTANLLPGAKFVMKRLKEDGHKLIIVSARGTIGNKENLYFDSVGATRKRFKDEGIDTLFEKCIFQVKDKASICKEEKIDLMIDDLDTNCLKIANNGIKVLYLKDAPSNEIKDNDNIITVYNWGEIYRYISENY